MRSGRIGQGRRVTTQVGYRKKKVLQWDPETERFTNDDEADAPVRRPLRAPWRV